MLPCPVQDTPTLPTPLQRTPQLLTPTFATPICRGDGGWRGCSVRREQQSQQKQEGARQAHRQHQHNLLIMGISGGSSMSIPRANAHVSSGIGRTRLRISPHALNAGQHRVAVGGVFLPGGQAQGAQAAAQRS